jgi:hypothetical protein
MNKKVNACKVNTCIERVYIPVICFEGQDQTIVESPEGRPVRGNRAKLVYVDKKEAEDALKHMLSDYKGYNFEGKILSFKRMKEDS